jgi:hypothetical protein
MPSPILLRRRLRGRALALPPQGGGGGGALSYTQSFNPTPVQRNFSGGGSTTFTAQSIGPSQNDRYVVCFTFTTGVSAVTGVTVGGNAMTLLGTTTFTGNGTIACYGRLVNAAEQAGTTANIVVSYANNAMNWVFITGGHLLGSASVAESGTEVTLNWDYHNATHALGSITPPASGMLVSCFAFDRDGTPSWSTNMTGDNSLFSSGASIDLDVGHSTTQGGALTPTVTGYTDAFSAAIAVAFAA